MLIVPSLLGHAKEPTWTKAPPYSTLKNTLKNLVSHTSFINGFALMKLSNLRNNWHNAAYYDLPPQSHTIMILTFVKEIFCPETNHYNLKNHRDFNLTRVRSVMYGSETVRYKGPQLWCTLPVSLRHSTNLIEFKTKIKAWKGNECQCQCRLCRNYVPLLGFI